MLSHDLLWTWYYTCVWLFLPFWCHSFPVFFLWDHMEKWFWCICFYFSKSHFGNFSLFGVTVKCWLLIGWKNYRFFAWFIGWNSYGYASTIGTIICYVLVIGFDWGALFIWVPSWFISWNLFWPTSLTGTLGGTAGGFAFMNILARVFNETFCTFNNFTKGIAGDGLCSAYIRSCAEW